MLNLILALLLTANIVGSSNGRTAGFEPANEGPIPSPAAASGHIESITPRWEFETAIRRWFQPADWATAVCIVARESGFDPHARGRLGEVGGPQTHPGHAWAYPGLWPLALAGDVEAQVAIMHNQWEGSGFWPWVAQRGVCW